MGGFKYVETTGTQHVEREARILGALCDADSGLVEDDVDAAHLMVEKRDVADIAFGQPHQTRGHG